jgi:holo-[acyl-carrier protein] synthase
VDIVGVDRIARLASEHHAQLGSVFTPAELEYCAGKRRQAEHLAAFCRQGGGAELSAPTAPAHAVVRRRGRPRSERPPSVRLHGEVAEEAKRRGISSIDVSLSHSAGLAIAEAIAISPGG